MKTNIFFGMMVVAMIIFCGCKKDILPATNPAGKTKIDQLKAWYKSHKRQPGVQNRDGFVLPEQSPVWDSTVYYATGNVYTAPLEKRDEAYGKIARSLVLHVDESGNVVSGEFTFIRLTNSPDNLSVEDVLNSYPKVFEFTDMPDNFEASMVKYDLEGNIIYSKHYANHVITDTDERIKSIERAPVATAGDDSEICIDSWWITYVNGEIYSIEYLGSVCFPANTPGTSGGTTPNPNTIDWQEVWDALMNNRHPISEKKSVTLLQLNSMHRTQLYDWYFFDVWYAASHVKFQSSETGQQYRDNGNWVWDSFTHTAITKENVNMVSSLNWTATCQLITPNPVFGNPMFPTWASIQLFYNINVTLSAATFTSSEAHNYQSICAWEQAETTNGL